MQYQVVRSAKRKSIALQIKNGQLLIRIPTFVTAEYIEQVVLSKQNWIEEKLKQSNPAPKKIQLLDESSLYWLGQPVTLQIELGGKARAYISSNRMIVQLNAYWFSHQDPTKQQFKIKQLIEVYAKECAQKYISEKLPVWSNKTNLVPHSSTVKKYRARWGSCNNKGELQFNYMLMMVPCWVFDYVIVHELCHLKYLNHSGKFWQLVGKYLPRYQEAKQWLKDNRAELTWD